MLLVVGPSLLVVEDSTLGDPFPLAVGIQFLRLGSYRRQRDAQVVLAERIDAMFDQIYGALPQPRVDLLLQPRTWLMMVVWVVAESG